MVSRPSRPELGKSRENYYYCQVKKKTDSQFKVHLILGARPNQMKLAPLFKSLESNISFKPMVIDTGQHSSANMSAIFRNEFQMPTPYAELKIGGGSHAIQTGKIMASYEELCRSDMPDWTIVFGDVNSTLACSLVAAKMNIPIAHAEAGLRSWDRTMPEEINRIVTDSVSSLLWTTSQEANENLLNEGHKSSNIQLIGNLMIDSLISMLPRIEKSTKYKELGLSLNNYCVATFHRPSNVDDAQTLRVLVEQLILLSSKITVVFPVHPRTLKALEEQNLYKVLEQCTSITLLEPLGYVDFLNLVLNSSYVLSDSGGVQEETAYLGIPCYTVRENTERPITIKCGLNKLIRADSIQATYENDILRNGKAQPIPFWDGKAAQRAVEHLSGYLNV
jgi:UDP-N-acetylglucosamine 2-epimerase (non-hydrolysing)